MPSGVSSNAQARINANGKPKASRAMQTRKTQSGAPSAGKTIEASWSNSHAATA